MADVMRDYVERGKVAGVVTLLCRHGEVHVDGIGARDLDTGAPIRRDTIFRIASILKPTRRHDYAIHGPDDPRR
jgi:CubicO group peptidase (beta-lactamase class C family)